MRWKMILICHSRAKTHTEHFQLLTIMECLISTYYRKLQFLGLGLSFWSKFLSFYPIFLVISMLEFRLFFIHFLLVTR